MQRLVMTQNSSDDDSSVSRDRRKSSKLGKKAKGGDKGGRGGDRGGDRGGHRDR